MKREFLLFTGTSCPALAARVAAELGVPLGNCTITRFPDGEVEVRLDEPVRGREILLIQSTGPPVNENLMELLILADACRRSAAARMTAIVPYFGYARADKRRGRREPITASLVAQLIQQSGIEHLITLDMHSAQMEGFFQIAVDGLSAVPILAREVREWVPRGAVIVSPDTGRVTMATEYAHHLGGTVAIVHKRRESGTETAVTHVVGEVRDRPCLIIDDMISTGGTIARAVEALLLAGARPEILVAASHGLFVGDAWATLNQEAIREVFVTDSVVPAGTDRRLRVVGVAELIAAAIRRVLSGESLSELYHHAPAGRAGSPA